MRASLLEDVVVLDLADEQGAICSRLLADLGAQLIKAEHEPLSRKESHCVDARKSQVDSGRPDIVRLIEESDVLVETPPPSAGLSNNEVTRINSRIVHVSITGFGRTGPRQSFRSSDFVSAAFGGQMYLTGSAPYRPCMMFPNQSCHTAGLFAANAVLLGLRKRRLTGKGCFIDLSIQETVASTLDPSMIDYFQNRHFEGRQSGDSQKAFTILPCRDGLIQITIFRNWEILIGLMSAERKAADLPDPKWLDETCREQYRDHINAVIAEWTRGHTKSELFLMGQSLQLPWAPVTAPEEITHSPQLRHRRVFSLQRHPGDSSRIHLPRLPFRLSASPSKRTYARQPPRQPRLVGSSRILENIRVLDLTRMLAGPFATRILADFGAEVIKVQTRKTARGAEQNDSPYFRAWNRNKRSICLNLDRPGAAEIFFDLVRISDVLVDNFSPRVMANWGFTYTRMKELKPDVIMASISAMGQTGPWRDFVGFAPTFHALAGIVDSISRQSGKPADIANSYGDIAAGLFAAYAILASIHRRDETGEGRHIDLSAYECLCATIGPIPAPPGRDFSGCYPCKGKDRWCVISIFDDKDWRTLCRIVREPRLNDSRYATQEGRRMNQIELDEILALWTVRYSAEELVTQLQKAGVASGTVQNVEDLARDPQLAARRFFVALGTERTERSALWPPEEKPEWKTAPRLGEDNEYVYRTLLRYSQSDYERLLRAGVIE